MFLHTESAGMIADAFNKTGADDEARTRYLHLGKVALYQMSYIRVWFVVFPTRNIHYRITQVKCQ